MTQPLVQPLTIVRGDTKTWTLTLTRGSLPVPFPTGTRFWFTAKNSLLDSDDQAIIAIDSASTFTTGSIAITSTSLGTASLSLFPPATINLNPPITLQYDIQLKEIDGTVSTVAVGTLAVTADATQRIT
jgi:hypothetical protein